jgi:hypothetical protein
MSEEIESYLLIGGSKDGEWFNIPSKAVEYSVPLIKFHPIGAKDVADTFGYQDILEERYIKVCINRSRRMSGKALYVFLSKELYDLTKYDSDVIWDVMCKLVNNYKVIK